MSGRNVVVHRQQWGDEGKGKIVDLLRNAPPAWVRFRAVTTAGHTLVIDGRKTVSCTSSPPAFCATVVQCLIGNGVVLAPAPHARRDS